MSCCAGDLYEELAMSLLAMIKSNGPSGFGYGSTAEDVTAGLALNGKSFLLTGCNSGLGLETLRVLTLRGAHVIAAARTLDKAQAACASVKGATTPVACELAEPASVRAVVAKIKSLRVPIDGIICNAGIMALPKLNQAYGYELQFFTNHMGHYILVTGLLDALAADARVTMLSSKLHESAPKDGIQFDNLSGEKSYSAWGAYGQSKLANLLFAKELARRFSGTAQTANALHPGVIFDTNLTRSMNVPRVVLDVATSLSNLLVLKTIPQGAATQCYVATNPTLAAVSGRYFADCNTAKPRTDAEDPSLASRLWDVSEKIAAAV
jgi:NAD(P)-dependent dehydrogenase (short-subunit alcohol dehydrogenase family)